MNPLLSTISRYCFHPRIARGRTRTNQRNKQRQRIYLEVLEDRLAPAAYALTDLGTPPNGFTTDYQVSNINNSGQIVEIAAKNGQLHPFLYSNGQWTDLGQPGSTIGSGFTIINNSGQILSTWQKNNEDHAFLYSNGKWTDLGLPNGVTHIEAEGLNDSGQVIGSSAETNGQFHSFLYSNGQWTDLGALTAWDINNSGQIVGDDYNATSQKVDAFLYSNGKLTDLGAPNGDASGGFVFISNSGQIVASPYVSTTAGAGQTRAFLYSNGQWTDLGTPDGLPNSTAYGINNSGQIVGVAANFSQQTPQESAFLYSNGKMADLNSLLPAGTSGSLAVALGINDNGQIVAEGSGAHVYLLTPQQGTGITVSNGTASPDTLTVSTSSQQVTVSAVIDNNDSPAAAGNVVFSLVGPKGTLVSDGPTGVTVGSNGQASDKLTVPAGTAAGAYSLQVAYTNNNQTHTQSFAGALSINAIAVNIALSGVSPTQLVAGTNAKHVTATATVTLASGSNVVNEGTVTFALLRGTTPIGQSVQVPVVNGTAKLTSSNPLTVPANAPPGSYTLLATYSDAAGSFGANRPATAKLTITSSSSPAPSSAQPTLFQAVDAVFLDGIVLAIDLLLGLDPAAVQASLDANLPYAWPFGFLFEVLGMEAVVNALQANNNT